MDMPYYPTSKEPIELSKEEWERYVNLSEEYKSEQSDLSDRDFRNWILFNYFLRMEDSQLKVALFELLIFEGYIREEP